MRKKKVLSGIGRIKDEGKQNQKGKREGLCVEWKSIGNEKGLANRIELKRREKGLSRAWSIEPFRKRVYVEFKINRTTLGKA